MLFLNREEEEELENGDEEDATLAEDLLDEVGEETDEEEELEGFGLITPDKDKSNADEEDKGDEDEEDEATLDEDAEDVDFDTFDDIDEM